MTRTIHYLPDHAKRVLMVTNPGAGSRPSRPLVDQLAERLTYCGMQVETLTDLKLLANATDDPVGDGIRAVVAAGGDGTVSAVVNATHPDTPITVLPAGTENLLAKYLHVDPSPVELSQAIIHGATVRLDTGEAGGRVFLLMAGCGFDADVVRRLHAERRGHIRHLSYIKPILQSVRSYEYPELRISCEAAAVAHPGQREREECSTRQGPMTWTARWLFVVNLPRYAGGLRFVPQAVGDDGWLDICAFEYGSLVHGLRYLAGVVRQKHLAWRDCRQLRVRSLTVESDSEVPYQLDGDPGGTLPVEIRVLPERVRYIVSESWALRRGFRHRTPGASRNPVAQRNPVG